MYQKRAINRTSSNEHNVQIAIIRSNKSSLINKEQNDMFFVEDMFCPTGKINSLIRDLCLYKNFKLHESLYNKDLININAETIIIFDAYVRIQFLHWIVKNNPMKRIILWFWNTIAEIGNYIPLSEIPESIEKWSYSKYDCEKYGFRYNTTFYPNNNLTELDTSAPEYDVCFIGKDKGRLKKLKEIRDVLETSGVKTYFHISPTHKYELKRNRLYKKKISYSEVKAIISKSRCILDCETSETAGQTIRPLEAMYLRKKLITDNSSLKDEDYYSKNNVFIYGKDDIKSIKEFLSTPYVAPDEKILKKYRMDEWVRRFFE